MNIPSWQSSRPGIARGRTLVALVALLALVALVCVPFVPTLDARATAPWPRLLAGAAPPSAMAPAASVAGALPHTATPGLPVPPLSVVATPDARLGHILLIWAPSADRRAAAYRIYRGMRNRGPLELVGVAHGQIWVDTQPARGTTYRYQVTALDRRGRESHLSRATFATLPR